MPVFTSSRTGLRSKAASRLPAQINAGDGISVVREGDVYTFSIGTTVPLIDKGVVSSGTVSFDVSDSSKQKLTVGGLLTIAFTGWLDTGTYSEIGIELVNGGNNVIWPFILWSNGDQPALEISGTNWVFIWSTDGGATLLGRWLSFE